jgi:hypothetical protein
VETTKNGDAKWSSNIVAGQLQLQLRVKPRAPFGGNNWVGVEINC